MQVFSPLQDAKRESDICDVLKHMAGFEILTEESLSSLSKIVSRRSYQRGTTISLENEIPTHFYAVETGLVRLYKTSESGMEFTVNLIKPNNFFSAIVIVEHMPNFWNAITMEDTTLFRISARDYRLFARSNPEYAVRMLQIVACQLRVAYERVFDSFTAAAAQRIINSICLLCSKFGTRINVTNSQLADLSGSTTATAIRVVGTLRNMGVVTNRRGVIVVKDVAQLESLSGRGLSSLDDFSRDFFD